MILYSRAATRVPIFTPVWAHLPYITQLGCKGFYGSIVLGTPESVGMNG